MNGRSPEIARYKMLPAQESCHYLIHKVITVSGKALVFWNEQDTFRSSVRGTDFMRRLE